MSMNKRRRVGRPKGAGKRFTKTKLKPASEKASIIKSYKWTAEQRARIAQACQMSSLREATIVKAGTMAMVDTINRGVIYICEDWVKNRQSGRFFYVMKPADK